jgi:putative glutamine amidotransferase
MKNKSILLLPFSLLLASICFIFSCAEPKDEAVKIAVSKLYSNYENWLLQSDSTLVITNLYPMGVDSALMMLDDHHALLVTGGEDVFPDWYGMIHDTARCGAFDRYRDTLEIMLIRKALEMNIPILGICRGHQILNVTLGGTLIIDIPDDIGDEVIHRCPGEPLACHHSVMVFEGSLLHEITGQAYGMVNTNHHQAVNDLAPGLRISAVSAEGLAEAIEYEDFTIRPYLLGVQWHPERMEDYPDLSTPIAKRFIQETKKYARRR